MKFLSGHCDEALVLIHGGAGPMDPSASGLEKATQSLKRITKDCLESWDREAANQLVTDLLEGLEDDEGFNAGYGSALQADGKPRLSAALMNGRTQVFSGVISVSDVRHPSRLALLLQKESSRVLTSPGHERLARAQKLPVENLVSPARLERWNESFKRSLAMTKGYDTVGVVLCTESQELVAGTSTGGRGFEEPGRVSDSATVAGTYASQFAAVSLTGIGEEIVDDAVAVRIETRVRDGMSLEDACRKTLDEAIALKREYGWVAVDSKGYWCAAYSTDVMTFLVQTLSGRIISSS